MSKKKSMVYYAMFLFMQRFDSTTIYSKTVLLGQLWQSRYE